LVQRFDRIMSFEDLATLTPSDKDSCRTALRHGRIGQGRMALHGLEWQGDAPALSDGSSGAFVSCDQLR